MKRTISMLIAALLLLAALPMHALAAPESDGSWSQYGKSGHSAASGDAVSFTGHETDAFTTLLYRTESDADYQTYRFKLSEGSTDWNTIEGSGLVFGAATDGAVINGCAVMFAESSVGLYKLESVDLSAMATTQFSVLSGVTPVTTAAKPSGTSWYIEITAGSGAMSMASFDSGFTGNKTTVFDNLSIESKGSGYGPFASFKSHTSSVISTSSFEQLSLTTGGNTAPVISASDVVVDRSGTFDPIAGVSITDAEDGDLTAGLQVVSNNVDTAVPGIYEVVYSAVDKLGLSGSLTRKVTVRADVEFIAVDAVNNDPIPGVVFSLGDEELAATDKDGRTAAAVIPGEHSLSIVEIPLEYSAFSETEIVIDSTKYSDWPAQIRVPVSKNTMDFSLIAGVTKLNGAQLQSGQNARYGDLVTYMLRVSNIGTQSAVPSVQLDIPAGLTATEDTLAKLSGSSSVFNKPVDADDHIDLELVFKVNTMAASTELTLSGAITGLTLTDGTQVTDINMNDNTGEAAITVKNASAVITVHDSEDETERLSGVELKFTGEDGQTALTGKTGDKGTFEAAGLAPGKYTITQLSAAAGFQIPDETYTITIAADGTVSGSTSIPNDPTLVTVRNVELTAQTDEDEDTADSSVEKPIAGGKFSIADAGGKEIKNGVFDENGEMSFQYMKPGKYALKLTTAAEGYIPSDKEYSFEITAAGKTEGDTKIISEPTMVVISKTDVDKNPVEGSGYEFYDSKGEKAAEGITGKDGKLTIKYLPVGKYTYKEVKAASMYALDPTEGEIVIAGDGAVTGDLEAAAPFANIVLKKVDAKTGKPLAGAALGLYDSADKQIAKADSDENGLVRFDKVPQGKFSIKELKAPEGYALSGKLITVDVTDTYMNTAEPILFENSTGAQTGVDSFPWWGFAIIAVCLIGGAGCALICLKKRSANKKRDGHTQI